MQINLTLSKAKPFTCDEDPPRKFFGDWLVRVKLTLGGQCLQSFVVFL
uniref:Uncharacterized protein n=1 Tax=Anguilla anguilla TaxID=7936 RepID=A0A0E9V4U7_ANGAN